MNSWFKSLVFAPFRHHFPVSLGIVILVSVVISSQITDRENFANSELYHDVIERWGAPIVQPVPSARYVDSGSVFNTLRPLPLDKQDIVVDAGMNYRKRGLVYFSGFDFAFRGRYEVLNVQDHDIDIVFVFPINMRKNQVLLSDFVFSVNGEPAPVNFPGGGDKLVWTGRAKPGDKLRYDISFRGRGLDSFTYLLDPELRVKDFRLVFNVKGGSTHDYQDRVAPAHSVTTDDDTVSLEWRFASLESGVPVGLILPSVQSYDTIIATMVRRSWAPFILFFAGIVCLGLLNRRTLRFYEAYLISACYALFFVLVAYLAAFMNFCLAYVITLAIITSLLYFYLRSTISKTAGLYTLGLTTSFLFVPTLAVILEGYTGLIYTLEIAFGLAVLMILTTRKAFRELIETIFDSIFETGESHVA